jgi:hypothetical protein
VDGVEFSEANLRQRLDGELAFYVRQVRGAKSAFSLECTSDSINPAHSCAQRFEHRRKILVAGRRSILGFGVYKPMRKGLVLPS